MTQLGYALLGVAPLVAVGAGLIAVGVVARRPRPRRWVWSLLFALAGGTRAWRRLRVDPEDDAIARLLEELAREIRSGCDCPPCEEARVWIRAAMAKVRPEDRALLAEYGITWDEGTTA